VVDNFKKGITVFDLRREKVQQNGWAERNNEVSNNYLYYIGHDSLMQPIAMMPLI
jgi:hypothetical protein